MTTYRKKVILACTGDTELNQWYPDTVYGSHSTIKILDRSPDGRTYALFKFETLPSGITFEKVNLCLFVNLSTYENVYITLRKFLNPWVESTATWNNTSRTFGDTIKSVTIPKAQAPDYDNKYYVFDLSGIQDYLRSANNGFVLSTSNDERHEFNTKENPNNKPYIVAYKNNNDPYEPSNLSPSDTDESGNVTFTWTYNSAGKGDSQTGVDIAVSADGQNWTTVHFDTAQQEAVLNGTVIPEGTAYWRIRSYNNLGGISDWSEIAQFEYEAINPEKPTDLAPVNTSIRGIVEMEWEYNASDEPGDVQTGYDIAVSYDGGETWTTVSGTGADPEHIFGVGTLQTGTIHWRVRTKNNYGGTSPWSDIVSFTFLGYAPRTPAPVSPVGTIVQNQDVTFVWQYLDAGYGDVQARYELQYSLNGISWTTVAANTSDESVIVPKASFETGTVYWKVRTKNDYGYYSDWSTTTTFIFAGTPKTPVIISPDSFSTASVKIEWTSSEQVSFHLKIMDGETTVLDTGEVASTTQKSYTQILDDDKTYTVQLRVKNMFDFWSEWATQIITVDFDVPAKPQIFVMSNERRGSIEINIINGVGEVEFKENEVFRRKHGEEEWTKIAAGLGENAKYEDCAVVSEEEYEYKARAVGVTLGYQDSDVSNIAKVKVRHTQLANTADYTQYVELIYNPKRTRNFSFEEELVHFAGRKKPVVERGEQEDANMMLSFIVRDHEDLEKLIDLIKQRETILLRDSRKKKMYVTINNLQVQEDWHNKQYEVSFTVNEVDFQEEVS